LLKVGESRSELAADHVHGVAIEPPEVDGEQDDQDELLVGDPAKLRGLADIPGGIE